MEPGLSLIYTHAILRVFHTGSTRVSFNPDVYHLESGQQVGINAVCRIAKNRILDSAQGAVPLLDCGVTQLEHSFAALSGRLVS
jgi:hypothetical protein